VIGKVHLTELVLQRRHLALLDIQTCVCLSGTNFKPQDSEEIESDYCIDSGNTELATVALLLCEDLSFLVSSFLLSEVMLLIGF